MAIDDFEWRVDVEETQASRSCQREAPTGSWLARVRQSVWLEPAARLAGMGALLSVLAGIGVVATTYAKPGRPLPEDASTLVLALGTSWLKPTAPEAASSEHPAPAHAAHAAHAAPASSGPHARAGASSTASAQASAPAPAGAAGGPAVPAEVSAPALAGVLADGRVVLNVASAAELTRLPGIGMRRAEAIVALRTKLKRFKQPTDLLRVKGIGPRGLKRMLPHLVLDAPPP